ncbi:hypothetical protein RRG08_060792 [Elysia crispata]|uniref:Uncharacterized protein n=1 Tax=Elysia crispata TaxID=231223 RepID=A0AAE0Y3N0_9GAST|nr:hypothetical protein RRG08_060792 [Elysia crispata]
MALKNPFRGISATLSQTERAHAFMILIKASSRTLWGERRRGSTATLHIATYNTRTLALQDDLDHLQEN